MVNNKTTNDDRLDSFLTTIESKLRGPFSSLDLSKAVSTASLRPASLAIPDDSNDPAQKYLDDLSSVFGRTNKVIQCRMLIGLLGLNDLTDSKKETSDGDGNESESSSQYLTKEILRILHETQGSHHEEWVRATSGLIEGVMFRPKVGGEDENTRESCRGEEAAKIIRDTGTEVCEKVECQIQNVRRPYQSKATQQATTAAAAAATKIKTEPEERRKPNANAANKRNRGFIIEKVKATSSQPGIKKEEKSQPPITQKQKPPSVTGRTVPTAPDLNACFAPYRYRLISTPILNTIVPEFKLLTERFNEIISSNDAGTRNCHFQVNPTASILQVDLKLEAQRAKDHGSNAATKSSGSPNSDRIKSNPAAASSVAKDAIPAGFRPTKKKRPASSLFNSTTKYRPQQAKTTLRRKGGGAQALLKSGATASGGGAVLNKLGGGGSAGSTLPNRTRPGGIGRFSSNRDSASRAGVGRSSRMKMIDDDDVDTLTKLQQSNANRNMSAAELRASKRKLILEKGRGGTASSFGNQQSKKQKVSTSRAGARPGIQRLDAATTEPNQNQQQQTPESWQSLLRDRSNKMSEDDKQRVQKFLTTNAAERSSLLHPSEGGPVYKIKIHEQRGKDPATGQDIKETFYLELDYASGDWVQSKKVKRY